MRKRLSSAIESAAVAIAEPMIRTCGTTESETSPGCGTRTRLRLGEDESESDAQEKVDQKKCV